MNEEEATQARLKKIAKIISLDRKIDRSMFLFAPAEIVLKETWS